MNNAELIAAIRGNDECNNCAIWKHGECNERKMSLAAADALEATDKRIAELEAQLPREGEWIWLSSTYDRVPREMRYWCSVCHHEEITHDDKPWKHYCPNCGARMDGETEHGNTYSLGKIEMPKGAIEQIIADGERKDGEV